MATELNKDITRESSVTKEDRNVMVTLTADQKIVLKLKGMKSGALEISIEDLYCHLGDCDKSEGPLVIHTQPKKGSAKNPMISLFDLRAHNAISGAKYEVLSQLDGIVKHMISEQKKAKKK